MITPMQGHRPAKEDYELLTVDIWDTVLRRRCHPDSVKLHVCRYVLLNANDLLSPNNCDPWVLLRLRQQAEKELGDASRERGLDDEYYFLDVYKRWLSLAGVDLFGVLEERVDNFLLSLAQIELAQEKYVSYVDPTIAETLEGCRAKRRYFLSDFYLPAAAIDELINYHGITNFVESGIVSCEVGLNKRSGRLYGHLHREFGVQPDRHLHLGDNLHSDVKAPLTLGIEAIHYQPKQEHGLRLNRERDFHARTDALRAATRDLMAQDAPQPNPGEAYKYGRQCSLLLIGFTMHVMERALADGVKQLYFFTREGEFFLGIYRGLAALDTLGFAPPPAGILQVSRVATFAGSLREISTSELMRLWNQYSTQSVDALLKSLGMEPDLFAQAADKYGIGLAQPIRYPWLDPKIRAFLGNAQVREMIEGWLHDKRQNLLAYLESEGLSDSKTPIGIVDIGWRGTIQDNLAHLLPTVDLRGYYLALNKFLNPQPSNARKSAFGPDLNRSADNARLLDFVAPLEMLCNSPNGSVLGYESAGGEIRVHRHIDSAENEIYESCTRHFQAGVLDAVPFWSDFLRTHAYSSNEIHPLAMNMWTEIIEHPPAFLAQAYFQLNHNETFGVGGFSDKRSIPKVRDLFLAVVSKPHRARVRQFLTETGWIPGLLACEDIDPAFRKTLRWLLKGLETRNRIRSWLR